MKAGSGKHMLFDVAAALLAVYLAAIAAAYLGRGALIYPGTWLRAGERSVVPGAERLLHRFGSNPDEVVHGYFLPPRQAGRPAPIAVHFHGNGEIAGDRRDLITFYQSRGFAVFLPEYRGYGGAGGTPDYAAVSEDNRALLDLVLSRPDVDRTRIVFHGVSLGSTFAVEAASTHPPRALVLESAFTSVGALAWRRGLPGFLLGSDYDTLARLPALAMPLFLAHGTTDRVVPFDMGEALRDARPGSTFIAIEGVDHILSTQDRRLSEPLAGFLAHHGLGSR
jgi:uncharacterized protein